MAQYTTGGGEEEEVPPVLIHAPMLVGRLVGAIMGRMEDPPPTPLTPTAEKGMAALAALVHALHEAHGQGEAEDADEAPSQPPNSKAGLPPYHLLVPSVVALLHKVRPQTRPPLRFRVLGFRVTMV